jgi:serine protease
MCCAPAHLGEDEAAGEGTPVRAIGPGTIRDYQGAAGYGELVVVVQHDLGATRTFINGNGNTVSARYLLSIYGHLRTSQVRGGTGTGLGIGSPVTEATVIGYVNDGAHNGDGTEHLHLGIRLSDEATARARDQGYWRRGYNTDMGTPCGGDCDADFAAFSQVIQQLNGAPSLVTADGTTVYWVQNNRKYHVVGADVLTAMQNAGVPGWSWSSIGSVTASQLASWTTGPELVTSSCSVAQGTACPSDGLLVRQYGGSQVFLVENGVRRWINSAEALNSFGGNWFPDVIDVAPAIMAAPHMGSTGNYVYGVGEGESDPSIKSVIKAAYDRNAGDSRCLRPTGWLGWPGTAFSSCVGFPSGLVAAASPSGASFITGRYHNGAAETGLNKGAIEYSSLGGYAVHGAIYSKYRDLSYTASLLGFPTSDEFWSGSLRRSNFEGGYITWDPATNQTVVHYAQTCTSFSINSASANPTYQAGSQLVTITGAPAGCQGGSWTASGNGSWITVSPASGNGSGSATVSWSQNASTSSRSASATLAGNTFSVNQGGAVASLHLVAPNGGEALEVGSSYTIRWTAGNLNPSGNIQILYYDGGWQPITSGLAPSTTQYAWTVPLTVSPAISLFVGNAVGAVWEVSDSSDASFLVTLATSFYTVSPCRVVDTRQSVYGPLGAGGTRRFTLTGACGIPASARAAVVNVTVTDPTTAGNVRFYPAGLPIPTISTLNYAAAQTRANNATLALGNDGAVDALCSQASGTAHVIVDVTGYYE